MSQLNPHPALNQLTLGKTVSYQDHYDAGLLQALPRSMNRLPLGLHDNALPFHGADIWTLYELSWLNRKGVPQVATAEVVLDANSRNLIESKSFKLYLNSYNQTVFETPLAVQQTLKNDLSACAQGNVNVTLFRLNALEGQPIGGFAGHCIDEQDITIDSYHFDATLLKDATENVIVTETLVSHLLKSNCLITHQPDWGSVQIRYQGPRIRRDALLRYLVSFRHHNEFHEQCVERIFHDIQRYCQPKQLTVYARYTRRGGLDINPWRSNVPFTASRQRLARQ